METRLDATDIPSILATEVYPQGVPGETLSRVWSVGGGVKMALDLVPNKSRVECTVTRTIPGREPDSVAYDLNVAWTRLNFGGGRAWLHCSRPGCGKRRARLYLDGAELVCRECAGIKYASKNQRKGVRAQARADRLRASLGGPPGPSQEMPLKPKGMHWSTYDARYEEIRELEAFARNDTISRITASEVSRRGPALSSADVASGYESPIDVLRHLLQERLRRDQSEDE